MGGGRITAAGAAFIFAAAAAAPFAATYVVVTDDAVVYDEAHHYDEKLSSITVRSKDGFAFSLDVAQIIHVGALDARHVSWRRRARKLLPARKAMSHGRVARKDL